jgi:hypothetical protein
MVIAIGIPPGTLKIIIKKTKIPADCNSGPFLKKCSPLKKKAELKTGTEN